MSPKEVKNKISEISKGNDDFIYVNPDTKFSQKGAQGIHTLFYTNATKGEVKQREEEKRQARQAQRIADQAREKYMDAIDVYKRRVNPNENQYSNKTVVLADGTRGFVNNSGYFQKYQNEKNTVGFNGCPDKSVVVNAPYAKNEVSLLANESIIGLAEPKKQYTSCGNEGKHVFVGGTDGSNAPATPLKCVTLSSGAMKQVKYPGESNPNQFTYDSCKRYAVNNGYTYFGLQNYNSGNGTNTCLVGNNYAKIVEGGEAKNQVSVVEVWNSSQITSPNSVRFSPVVVGSYPSYINPGTTKVLDKVLQDPTKVVGNMRINQGSGANDRFEVKQNPDGTVAVTRIGARGWGQYLILPAFDTSNDNHTRGLALMNTPGGLRDMQNAYSAWERSKKGGDIIVDSAEDDLTLKPPKIFSLKILAIGQIVAYPELNQKGVVILRIPQQIPEDSCNEFVGPLSFTGATYGKNAPKSKATDNNALQRLSTLFNRANNPDVFSFKVTNRLVESDPAPGYGKDLIINYKCGDEQMPDLTAREGKYARVDCNITRSEAGNPCTTELRILGGDNVRGLAGLELVVVSAEKRENLVWKYYLSAEQTKSLIEDDSPSDNDYLRSAKFVGKMTSDQTGLNFGEYAISSNGKLEVSINEGGHMTVSVRTSRNECVKTPDGNRSTLSKTAAFIYSVPYKSTDKSAVGKFGYVDYNGVLHPYRDGYPGYKGAKGFEQYIDTKISENNLPEQPEPATTLKDCQEKCQKDPNCFGAVYEKNSQVCYLKDRNALTAEMWTSKNDVFLKKNIKLDRKKIPKDCTPWAFDVIDSVKWNAYPKSVKPMTKKSTCDLKRWLQEPSIKELRDDWLRKQDKANKDVRGVSEQITKTIDNKELQGIEADMNNSSLELNQIVYDNTMDNKIPRASYGYGGELPERIPVKNFSSPKEMGKKEGFTIATGLPEDYNEILENKQPHNFAKSQRERGTRYRNLNGIVDDTELLVVEQHYNMIVWTVAGLVGGILAYRLLSKLNQA